MPADRSSERRRQPTREEEAEARVGALPVDSLEWLQAAVDHPAEIDALSKVATMRKLPPATSEAVAQCYHLSLALVQSDRAQLGWRLHALMPRMLFGALSQSGQKGAVEMRKRCARYLRGDWRALLEEAPPVLTPAQRVGLQEEASVRRG